MKPQIKKYAPFGLYLTIVTLIGSIGYYIVTRSFNLPMQILLGLAIIGIAVFIIFDPKKVREFITGRQAKYGSNALIMSIAFAGIIIVINYLVNNNSFRWDLTENKEHTLVPESINTLESLSEPVTAEAFFTSYYSTDTAKSLLDSFAYESDGNFSYEFIDPEKNPIEAQRAEVTRDGTIVLYMGEQKETVTFVSEKEITTALIKLANPQERTVRFLTGHGEYDPSGSGDLSYSQVNESLLQKNYQVEKLNLLTNPEIPDNTLAIIIARPQKSISEDEINLLDNYLKNGGSIVVLIEPSVITSIPAGLDLLVNYLNDNWNINVNDDIAIDPNPSLGSPLITLADQYANHVITNKLMNIVTIFPTTRSIETTESDTLNIENLVTSSSDTWGEFDIPQSENEAVEYDEGKDITGPLNIAVAVTDNSTDARLVIFGDSDFASDQYFYQYGNGDLIINSIDWAAEQEDLISLTPKDQTTRYLVAPKQYTLGLLLLISVFIIPGIVVFTGINTFVQRKRKG